MASKSQLRAWAKENGTTLTEARDFVRTEAARRIPPISKWYDYRTHTRLDPDDGIPIYQSEEPPPAKIPNGALLTAGLYPILPALPGEPPGDRIDFNKLYGSWHTNYGVMANMPGKREGAGLRIYYIQDHPEHPTARAWFVITYKFDRECNDKDKLLRLAAYAWEGIKWFVPPDFPVAEGVFLPQDAVPGWMTFRHPPYFAGKVADLWRSMMLKRN